MRGRIFVLCLLASFVSGIAGAEIQRYTVRTNEYAYRDRDTNCSHNYWVVDMALAVQVKDDRAVKATFTSHLGTGLLVPDKFIDYTPSELSGMAFHRDAQGRTWIKTLPMSERILRWAFYETRSLYCSPPYYSNQLLVSAVPASFLFHFDTSSMEKGGPTASQTESFRGVRRDGYPYDARVQWSVQRER